MTALRSNAFAAKCSVCSAAIAERAGFYRYENDVRVFYCASHNPEEVQMLGTAMKEAADAAASAPPIDLEALTKATDAIVRKSAEHFARHVPALVKETMLTLVREVSITVGKAPAITVKHSHAMLPVVLQALAAGASPFLVGPAGSGKTTLAEQCATVLKLPFYIAARVTSEFKLVGFRTATGDTVRTQFREAFEHGGVFLFDEVDASDPDALTAFNAALANGLGDFPDGMVKRHAKFYAIAAGNTYGRGADRQYVGRNQLDAATLDRFQVFDVDYDELLEVALAGNAEWAQNVQRVRKAVELEKVRHIVSPRASIVGAKMLASGMDRKVVMDACVWKGLPADQRQRIETRMVSL